MSILQVQNLSKAFGNKYAVRNVNLALTAGKIYGLVGPNGSGKSTLMKMIAGLFYPNSGSIMIMNQKLNIESKEHVSYMSTEPYFYNYMSIKTVGDFHADFYKDFDMNEYIRLIQFMELDMSMKVNNLSSGMAAKLKIAANLSRKTKLYMLDEPLNGIDLVARKKIISAIIEKSNDDNIMMISSHLIEEMEKILDEVIFIKNGDIVLLGECEKIREEHKKSIADLYLEVYANA